MSLIAASLLGFGLGVKHALEADHLAAVCTFVSQGGGVMRAAKSGAIWGAGHAAVIVLAGGALVITGASVPGPLAFVLDLAVAIMLIGLGVASVLSARAREVGAGEAPEGQRAAPPRRSLAVGVVHGASGTAALTLLVASTIQARFEAIAFVTLFGIASVVGMAVVAGLLAWPLRSMARRAPARVKLLQALAGAASIVAGLAVGWSTMAPGA